LAWLVPESHREEWQAEWFGELAAYSQHRSSTSSLQLRMRCLGAVTDAFWFRRRFREPLMIPQNFRYALRLIHRRPAFSSVVVLSLALGIGGTTAIYSVVNAVLLRQLPYQEPERLFMLWGEPTDGDAEKVAAWTSYPDYVDLKQSVRSFAHFAAFRTPTATLTIPNAEPRFVQMGVASADLWPALEITPAMGRAPTEEDSKPGAPSVVLLGDNIWRSQFGGSEVLGRTIHLDGTPFQVIGVLPRDFHFASADLWTPLVPGPLDQMRGTHTLQVLGRLNPGITPAEAEEEARQVAARLEQLYPQDNSKRSARLELLHEATVGASRDLLTALMGGVALVLLIVCCNVGNLFLVRATSRGREIAVRAAVGAGRGRLFHQFLTESLVLTLLGAVAALPIAWWGVRALVAAAPQNLARLEEISIDPAALGFMLLVAVVAGLLFGTVPSLHLLRHPPGQSINDRGLGPRHGRGSRAFVVSQLALAAVLAIGASLLAKSLWQLSKVDLRFNPDGLVVSPILLPAARYESPEKVLAFHTQLRERLAAAPGVASVSLAFEHPMSPGWTSSYIIDGAAPVKPGEEPEARVRPVAPGYFGSMGVRVLRGRDISSAATMNAPGEVVINRAFADRHFPGVDPIGRRLHRMAWWPGQPTTWEIVGLVDNERFLGLDTEADPATYFPHAQFPMKDMYLLVRGKSDAAGLDRMIQQAIWSVDRDLAIEDMTAMEDILADLTAAPRFNVQLIGLFAAVALLLAAVGVYGVLAHSVAQRTPEIGIRLALGAEAGSVLRMIVGQGLRLSLLGAGIGLLMAYGVTRILQSQLYDVRVRDPLIFAVVAAILVLVALAAAYLPARRASRLDPILALRHD
jgi:putative ABC transport system permease protein